MSNQSKSGGSHATTIASSLSFSTPSYLTKPCYTATTCWTSANSRAIYAEQSDSRWCIFTRQSPHFTLQLGSTPPKNFESLVRIMSSRKRPQVHTRLTWPGCPQIRKGAPRAGLHDDAHNEQDPYSQRPKPLPCGQVETNLNPRQNTMVGHRARLSHLGLE